MTHRKKTFENIREKGENAGSCHFDRDKCVVSKHFEF